MTKMLKDDDGKLILKVISSSSTWWRWWWVDTRRDHIRIVVGGNYNKNFCNISKHHSNSSSSVSIKYKTKAPIIQDHHIKLEGRNKKMKKMTTQEDTQKKLSTTRLLI